MSHVRLVSRCLSVSRGRFFQPCPRSLTFFLLAVTRLFPQFFHQYPPPRLRAQFCELLWSLSLSTVVKFIPCTYTIESPALPEYPLTFRLYQFASLSTTNVLYSAQYQCPLSFDCRSNLTLYRPSLVS